MWLGRQETVYTSDKGSLLGKGPDAGSGEAGLERDVFWRELKAKIK